MQIFMVIALIIAILAVLFALQNLTTVTITFFLWSIQSSLALVLLVAVTVGVIFSILTSLPGVVRNQWTTSSQKKKLTTIEEERNTYQKRAEEAEKDVKVLEEQLASLSAALDKSQPGDMYTDL